jgi:hypothetical protein
LFSLVCLDEIHAVMAFYLYSGFKLKFFFLIEGLGNGSAEEKALGKTAWNQMMAQEKQVISDTDRADARYCGGGMTGTTGWVCW